MTVLTSTNGDPRRPPTEFEWFVIDELSRTSRNVIESLRLNELVQRAGVRLAGAGDSCDIAGEQSKILLSIMATMHEMQIDQDASRVNRGIGDAFKQGRLVQPPTCGTSHVVGRMYSAPACTPPSRSFLTIRMLKT